MIVSKICLLTDHHLSINPRLWKEAFFYKKNGFEVVIIGKYQSAELLEKDLEILKDSSIVYKHYLDLIPGNINGIKRFYFRARKRLSCEMQKHFNIGTSWAINHAPDLMYKMALKENADLYVAHLETAFYVGRKLVRAGKKVAFDFEDWYSRDFLVPERPVKLLEKIEHFALVNGVFCTATSQSMAAELQNHYPDAKPVTVIYNGFEENKLLLNKKIYEDVKPNCTIKLLWFSRTIGPNRGIEFLIKALAQYENPVDLHLLGDIKSDYHKILENIFPYQKKHSLTIHSFLPHYKLNEFISQFQIGLSIEENINDNKKLTISNKLLQYLQAGIPVLATSTKGQLEVAALFPHTVKIVDLDKPEQWGLAIDSLRYIENEKIVEQKNNYQRIFSWEVQEIKLNKLLETRL